MTLMFFAVVESSLSFISACLIAWVIFKSAELFDWSPDLWVSPERSRSLVAVLSGFVFSLPANAARLNALRQAKASVIPFMSSFVLFARVSVLLIVTSPPTGFIYLAATLIADLANLVSFLSVSDSSVKVV